MSESRLLDLRCQIEELICQREGMIADNKQREFEGNAMAYSEDSFLILQRNLEFVRQQIQKATP